MAKVCKFCSHDNDETLEFCEHCGSKLPVFHKLAVVEEERKPKKRIKINFFAILLILLLGALLYCFYLAFWVAVPDDELPDYSDTIRDTKRIISSLRHIKDDAEKFNVSLYVPPEAVSLYLTSLGKPSILEKDEYDEDVTPRLLIYFPKDKNKEFSLVHREIIWGMEARTEFIFKQHENEDIWFLDDCILGKLPLTYFRNEMLEHALEEFARHPDMKKILKAKLDLKHRKSYVYLSLQYEKEKKENMIRKVGGFLSDILGKTKNAVTPQQDEKEKK